jgi:heterodisulfide reductase subunit B
LQHTFHLLCNNSQFRTIFEKKWKTTFNPQLHLLPFLRFLAQQDLSSHYAHAFHSLKGLPVVSYYGCMLSYPPDMSKDPQLYGIMEKIMKELGAEPLMWSHSLKCCGTFLSVARPDIATPLVNDIFSAAIKAGAECLVTACSMCHLNLEVRCSIRPALPVFHFSELLALALGSGQEKDWFNRHLTDPKPLLRRIGVDV